MRIKRSIVDLVVDIFIDLYILKLSKKTKLYMMLTNATFHTLCYIQNLHGGHRSRDRMVVRFTTIYAISSNSAHGEKKKTKVTILLGKSKSDN